MKGKTVIILGGAEGVAWFSRRESQLQGISLYVIDSEAAIACEEKSLAWEPLERFHDFSDIEKINAAAYTLSHNWWKQPEVREVCPFLTNYSGFPLGHLTELPFYHLLAVFARSILTMRRLIENEKPEKLIVFNNQKNLRGGAWISFGLKFHFGSLIATAREEGVAVEEISLSSALGWHLERLKKIPRIPAALARRGKAFFKGKLSRKLVPNGSFTHRSPYRVLLYAEERHGDVMLPLLEAIAEDPEVELIALTQDLSEHCAVALREKGVPLFNPESFLDKETQKKIRAEFRKMQGLGKELKRVDGKKLFFSPEIQATLWPHIQLQMDWFFEDGLLNILKRVKIAEKTLDFLSPHLLLTPVDQSINNLCWIFPAKQRSIPCLTQLHGSAYIRPSKTLWGTMYADQWAVQGPLTKEWLQEATDYPPEKFVCCGSPFFESLQERFEKIDSVKVYEKLGLDPGKPVILFLVSMVGGPFGSYFLSPFKIYEFFLQEMAKVPNAQIVIRVHPVSDRSLPHFMAKKYAGKCLVNPKTDLLSVLKVSDVVVGQPTSALVQAMIVQKPVLLYFIMMAREATWWVEKGNLEAIFEPSEIVPKVSSLLGSKEERRRVIERQNKLVERQVGPLDGKASERTIALIKKMIGDVKKKVSAITSQA